MKGEKVFVAGAGLVGSLLAILLAKRGLEVTLFERRPDMRKSEAEAGRSINLALSDRGWRGLKLAGIDGQIREIAIPMYGRKIHDIKGNLSFLPYGKENQFINSVSRAELNKSMMTLAEEHGVKIEFNSRCTDAGLTGPELFLEDAVTGETSRRQADRIFAADGAFSAVRLRMQMTGRFDYSQRYMRIGYKELNIPPASDGSHLIEKNALHIWPRGDHMMIALPNLDGSFTCTLFFPFEGPHSFDAVRQKGVMEYFRTEFPDAVPLMPTLEEDYAHNPESSLVMVECSPWWHEDKLLMIGDAVHAMVPFYGQGMNCGFEDCVVLWQEMERGGSWEEIFRRFGTSRKPDTDAISELARRNFHEMSDLSGDPQFRLRKKIESRFSERHPDKWLPLYSMVTFSDLPYSTALREGDRQDRIMKEVMEMPGIGEKWDSEAVEERMLRLLEEHSR